MTDKAKVSVIIPTLNEGHTLPKTLSNLKSMSPKVDEVIVVDGGSTDDTHAVARSFGCRLLRTDLPGRAVQMDLGARQAEGEVLVFLHADTFVPEDMVKLVKSVLDNRKYSLGAFVSVMRGEKLRLWFSFLNYIKTYLCPLFYRPAAFFRGRLLLLFGDQVMFCRRADYLAVEGFDIGMKVMEEADFCIRMSRVGRAKMIHRFVYSSDRRVSEWGFWKANRIYWFIAFGWAFGLKNAKMADIYTDIR